MIRVGRVIAADVCGWHGLREMHAYGLTGFEKVTLAVGQPTGGKEQAFLGLASPRGVGLRTPCALHTQPTQTGFAGWRTLPMLAGENISQVS